ncbi:acyl-CoA oxidase [Lichtheimia hyalospora FSU 10163]|nr:acyl-CoA oxidase [Lichtheimia hyalospora FSU 10163]
MSLQAPKDMARERAATDFHIDTLAYYWAGDEQQYRLMQQAYDLIKNDPELVVQPPRNYLEMTRPEAREFTMGQIYRLVTIMQDPKMDPNLVDAVVNALLLYSENFGMRIAVHRTLFRNVLLMLGTDDQQKTWLPLVENYRILGCFAMTELGHSSALRDIETTSTYDQATDTFVVNSPTITSTKWWIGMAGQTATHTMVIAQTYVGGKNVGHNWFIVQLRDTATGELMPNVQAGDIGHKVGRPGLDNGWIQFSHVRIPRDRMLSRFVNLNPKTGTFTPAPSPAIMYATLIPERIYLVSNNVMMLTQAITIATRYGVVRRQQNNQQIMDYQSHYAKMVPAISFMYMVKSATRTLDERFKVLTANGEMNPKVYLQHMSEMHAISAALKGISGWYGSDILETCRRSCGGHAYSAYNNIGQIIDDWGVTTTGGGDNVVLMQQTAKILIQQLHQELEHDKYPKLLFKASSHYIQNAKAYLDSNVWGVQDVSTCLEDLGLIEDALHTILLNSIRLDEKNMSSNDLLLESVRAAELHGATFLYSDAVTKYANNRNDDQLVILRRLTALWGFHTLITYSDQAFKENYLTASQLKSLERVYLEECKSLRKQVIGLTDAWGYPDFVLKAPIAKYDGNIYEPYFDTLLMAPNSTGIPSYHEKYIKPLTSD